MQLRNVDQRKKTLQEAKNNRVLRPIPRLNHYDMIVSHELEEISKVSTTDKKIAVQSKFRTILLYGRKRGELSYIIQMKHSTQLIDWLKVKKPSIDAKGFGLFAMQDISQHKLITFYLGDLFTTEDEKNMPLEVQHTH